jgi:hypothetical protein
VKLLEDLLVVTLKDGVYGIGHRLRETICLAYTWTLVSHSFLMLLLS